MSFLRLPILRFRASFGLVAFLLVLVGIHAIAQPNPSQQSIPQGSRCDVPILVCQTEILQSRTDSTFLTGEIPVLPCFSTNSNVNLTRNGVWYKVRIYRDGFLGFMIRPLTRTGRTDTTANYDWAVFKFGDSSRCGALGNPLACNSERRGGLTGASGQTQNEEGGINPAFTDPIANVRRGEEYLVLVLNPNNHGSGFALDFGFSSSPDLITQTEVEVLSLSAPSRLCLTNTVTVRFSDLVRVSSVVPQAFRLESERGIERVITGISAQRFGIVASALADAFDSVFTFQFNEPISQTETYKLRVLRDIPSLCGILPADATTASVISVGPRVEIRGVRAYCSGDGAKLSASSDKFAAYLWTNLNTGRVIGTGSTVIVPEGEYILSVIDNNGCRGESIATVRSTTAITLVLTAQNNNTRFCNFSDNRQYVLLQTSPDFERYEWLVNGVVTTGTVSEKYIFGAPGRYQVRAFANGCMAESNVVNVQMFAPPTKPQIRQIGNYLSVVNRIETSEKYYWVRVNRNGTLTGIEGGYEFSPSQSGLYFVQGSNANECRDNSDTINFILTPVRVRLATGSYQANHARSFDMNFTMTNIVKSIPEIGSTSITFSLRMDSRVLGPSPSVQFGLIGVEMSTTAFTRRITCSWSSQLRNGGSSGIIGALKMLGTIHPSTATTSLILENAYATTPTGKRLSGITFELETTGTFRVANAPPRLLNLTTATDEVAENLIQLSPVKPENISIATYPNPIATDVSLSMSISAETPVTAWIQDTFGNTVKHLFTNEQFPRGKHERTFSLAELPTGMYVMVVRTPNNTQSSLLSLRR